MRNLSVTLLEQMKKDVVFSECGKYRYFLSRIWDIDKPYAMVIGLNPSTADAQNDDPTIRNLVKLLDDNGYGGLYMMNLFALISPNPEDLRSCPDPVKENDVWLHTVSKAVRDIFFAWGSFKQAQYRIKNDRPSSRPQEKGLDDGWIPPREDAPPPVGVDDLPF